MEVKSRPIVFLDRDGTINVDSGYVCNPDDVELLPGAADAIARIRHKGFDVVVVSNQSAIGRGYASVDDVEATNLRVQQMLYSQNSDAKIDLWCYAPDHPDHATSMRKPGVGMLDEVRRNFKFNVIDCWMAGDKPSDVEFGINAGIPPQQCVFLQSNERGDEQQSGYREIPTGVLVVKSLQEMVYLSAFN